MSNIDLGDTPVGTPPTEEQKIQIRRELSVSGTTESATNPGTTNDSSEGYDVGSIWINTDELLAYQCLSASEGFAEWALLTLSVDEVQSMIDIANTPYGITYFLNGNETLDRNNGQFQYGSMSGNTVLFAPDNGAEGQQISVTFTTDGAHELDFSGIEFDFDTTGLLPIVLEANKSYSIDMRVKGSYWTFESISGGTDINATINASITLTYYDSGLILQWPRQLIPNRWKYFESSLTDLVVGTGVTGIGREAFYGCSNLGTTIPNLIIPNNVQSIGIRAFKECSGYAGTLTLSTSLTRIERGVFRDCSNLTGDIEIPSSVTYIGVNAFYGCESFAGTLTLPASLTYIDQGAFYGCSSLTGGLALPASLTNIGLNAFRSLSGMTGNIEIPSSVTYIGNQAFGQSTGFGPDLDILSPVITIDINAFNGCTGLTTVNCYAPFSSFRANSLANTSITAINVYGGATGWIDGGGQTIGGKSGITVTIIP